MTITDCPGLDGSNPLHFLASLGVLRILPEGSLLSWRYEGGWHPRFEHDQPNMPEHLSQGIRRGVPDHSLVTARVSRSGEEQKAEPEAADRKSIATAYDFLGFAPIPKTTHEEFRRIAKMQFPQDYESMMDPLSSIGILGSLNAESPPGDDGMLEPTAFSFSNGGGGQVLHDDFITLASLTSPEAVSATLEGRRERFVWCTSLNWDPKSLRSYAHQWGNPESQPKETDVAANALAFIGLGAYPVVPRQGGSRTLGIVAERRRFRWPMWERPIPLLTIESLVHLAPEEQSSRRSAGIVAIFEAERFSSNKRIYFAPASAV
ncbi:MAG: hypothetical protein M0001_08145 [Treponema sp.]|nr:hypothetical protein [Treponema sp.]